MLTHCFKILRTPSPHKVKISAVRNFEILISNRKQRHFESFRNFDITLKIFDMKLFCYLDQHFSSKNFANQTIYSKWQKTE